MGQKSNQHYVPQFYFRFFSNDKKSICVLHRKNGSVFPSASIKGQASRHNFYGGEDIENLLSKLEMEFSAALRKLKDCKNINEINLDEYHLILQAIIFQRSRTLTARNKSELMFNKMLKLHLMCEINNSTDVSDEEKKSLLSDLENIVANPQYYQGLEITTALQNFGTILDLTPIILVNKTNRPFIFGDSPVVFTNGYYGDVTLRGVLGFQAVGLQIFFPLSPSRVFLLIDSNKYEIKSVKHGNIINLRELNDVLAINKLQLHSATNAVYFSNIEHQKYIKYILDIEYIKLKSHVGKVIEAPAFDHSGVSLGDIVHSFEPQLPIKLNLSFLKHDVLSDAEYKYATRVP